MEEWETFRDTEISPEVFFAPVSPIKERLRSFVFTDDIEQILRSSTNDEVVQARLWPFPDELCRALRRHETALSLHLFEVVAKLEVAAEDKRDTGSAIEREGVTKHYRRATRVTFKIRRARKPAAGDVNESENGGGGSGWEPNLYEVSGTSEAERRFLDLLHDSPDRLDGATLRLWYRADSSSAQRTEIQAKDVLLFTTNLSDRPSPQERVFVTTGTSPEASFSAVLSEPRSFVELLRRLSIVNTGGYFLFTQDEALKKCFTDKNIIELDLLILYDKSEGDNVNGIRVEQYTNSLYTERERPIVEGNEVILIAETDDLRAYDLTLKPGVAAFRVTRSRPSDNAEDELERRYNLLDYGIDGDSVFRSRPAHTSLPVSPESPREESLSLSWAGNEPWVYELTVPLCKHVRREQLGSGVDSLVSPYAGIGAKARIELGLRDVFGNRVDPEISIDPKAERLDEVNLEHGYFDRILTWTDWPGVYASWECDPDTSQQLLVSLHFDQQVLRHSDLEAELLRGPTEAEPGSVVTLYDSASSDDYRSGVTIKVEGLDRGGKVILYDSDTGAFSGEEHVVDVEKQGDVLESIVEDGSYIVNRPLKSHVRAHLRGDQQGESFRVSLQKEGRPLNPFERNENGERTPAAFAAERRLAELSDAYQHALYQLNDPHTTYAISTSLGVLKQGSGEREELPIEGRSRVQLGQFAEQVKQRIGRLQAPRELLLHDGDSGLIGPPTPVPDVYRSQMLLEITGLRKGSVRIEGASEPSFSNPFLLKESQGDVRAYTSLEEVKYLRARLKGEGAEVDEITIRFLEEEPIKDWVLRLPVAELSKGPFQEITVSLVARRPSELVHSAAKEYAEARSVTVAVPPRPDTESVTDNGDGKGLLSFANEFEQCFPTHKLATGVGADLPKAFWAVRRKVVTLKLQESHPVFSALPPISRELYAGTVDGEEVRDLDLDALTKTALGYVETAFEPSLAARIARIDRLSNAEVSSNYQEIAEAKESVAESLSSQLRTLFKDPNFNPTADAVPSSKKAVRDRLRADLNEAYGMDTVLLFQLEAEDFPGSGERITTGNSVPSLYGQIVAEPENTEQSEPDSNPGQEATRAYRFAPVRVDLHSKTPTLTVLFDATQSGSPFRFKKLSYRITHVDRLGGGGTELKPAAWLHFLTPEEVALVPTGDMLNVPVPLRTFPALPTLLNHRGIGKSTAENLSDPWAANRSWHYNMRIQHEGASQDTLVPEYVMNAVVSDWKEDSMSHIDIGRARRESDRLALVRALFSMNRDLPSNLAVIREWDVTDPIDEEGDKKLLDAVDTVVQTIREFGEALKALLQGANRIQSAVGSQSEGVYRLEEGELRLVEGVGRPLQPPKKEGNGSEVSYSLQNLDILCEESVWGGVLLRRNANLHRTPGKQEKVHEDFVYETPVVRFAEPLTPFLDRPDVIQGATVDFNIAKENRIFTAVLTTLRQALETKEGGSVRVQVAVGFESGRPSGVADPGREALRRPRPVAQFPIYTVTFPTAGQVNKEDRSLEEFSLQVANRIDDWLNATVSTSHRSLVLDVKVFSRASSQYLDRPMDLPKSVLRYRYIQIPFP